jgi:putative transposase
MRADALLPDYRQRGGPGARHAAGERKRGAPGALEGINITPHIHALIVKGLEESYLVRDGPPFTRAWTSTLGKYFNVGGRYDDTVWIPQLPEPGEAPTESQAHYHFALVHDRDEVARIRMGARRYRAGARGLDGDTSRRLALGPGSLAEIDATVGDVMLVKEDDRWALAGRVTIYKLIDVYSRLIMAIHVTFENNSALAVGMLLLNAVSDKQEYCKLYGVTITPEQWSCRGLPQRMLGDGELKTFQADAFVETDSILDALGTTPAYAGQDKPVVESSHRSTNDALLHRLQGSIKPRAPGDRDPALDACHTYSSLVTLLIRQVLTHNQSARLSDDHLLAHGLYESGVPPHPNEVWRYGLEHHIGGLTQRSPDEIRLRTLPRGQAVSTEDGIRFSRTGQHPLLYTCELAISERWAAKARQFGAWEILVRYHPHRADRIFLLLEDGRPPVEDGRPPIACELKNTYLRFAALSWFEIEAEQTARAEDRARDRTREQQAKVGLIAHTDAVERRVVAERAEAGPAPSLRARRQELGANRAAERERLRPANSWLPGDERVNPEEMMEEVDAAEVETASPPRYIRPAADDDLFDEAIAHARRAALGKGEP